MILTWIFRACALAVALGGLAWALLWRSNAPEPTAWRELLGEAPLRYGFANLFAFDGEANRWMFRLVHTLGLALPGSDFKRVALLGWIVAALFCVAAWRLVGRTFIAPRRPALAAFGLLVLTASVFSPRYGASFLLDARFRVFVPSLCMVLALLLLLGIRADRPRSRTLRFVGAGMLAFAAAASDRLGEVVWLALVPMVVLAARRSGSASPLVVVVLWLLCGNLGHAFVRDEAATSALWRTGLVTHVTQAPREALEFGLRVAGHGVPDPYAGIGFAGVASGGVLCASALVAMIALLAVRRDPTVRERGMPFLCCILQALLGVLLCLEAEFPAPVFDALHREFTFGMLLLPFGIAGLLAVRFPRAAALLGCTVLPVLFGLVAWEWRRELPRVEREHRVLRQGEVLLAFAEHGKPLMPRLPLPPITSASDLASLRTRGLLRTSSPATALAVAHIRSRTAPPGQPLGILGSLTKTAASGFVQDVPALRAPDVVLLSRTSAAREETVFALAAPDFLATGPAWAWAAELTECEPLTEGERVRAYGLHADTRELVPLMGAFAIRGGVPVAEEAPPR